MAARAHPVPEDELAYCADVYSQRLSGLRRFGVEALTGDADLRLCRVRVTEHSVLIGGSDPTYGRGVDSRSAVTL